MAIVSINDEFEAGDDGAPLIAERAGKALLHWVNGPDVRNVFYTAAVTRPPDVEGFVALWEASRAAAPTAPLPVPGASLSNLPAATTAQADDLLQSEQFRTQYRPFGVTGIASVDLPHLITPQMWVDEEFVDELVQELPADGDDNGLFDFCFPNGRLGNPSPFGTNGAAFTSRRRQIGGLTPLRVRHYSPEKVTFEFDAIPRPNWLSVAIIETGRIVIRNGVHHALALLKAGRRRAFTLVQNTPTSDLFNYQEPAFFKPNRLLAPRPPLLRDYLDPSIAAPVAVQPLLQYLKFGIVTDGGFLPPADPSP